MKLLTDANGVPVLKDGLPVYKYADGTEMPFDASATLEGLNKKIKAEEEKATRFYTEREELKKAVEPWKGLKVDEVKKALETVKNLSAQEILDQRGIEELKRQMRTGFDEEKSALAKSYEPKLNELQKTIAEREAIIYDLAVTNKFATSEYFSGEKPKTVFAPEHATRIYGNRFKVDINGHDYKVIALDEGGKPLMSKKNHGELADFNEAVGILVEQDSKKNRILKGTDGGGPHSQHALNSNDPNFKNLSATEQIKAGLQKRKGLFG
jgi:hypothetical protein